MRFLLVLAALAGAGAAGHLVGQGPAHAAQDEAGLYTGAQADRGAALYDAQCVECHGEITQMIPEMAALLADHTFRARWQGRSLGELFELIQVEMPQDAPGTLSNEEAAALVAFILRGNRRPAGEVVLPGEVDALTDIPFDPDR